MDYLIAYSAENGVLEIINADRGAHYTSSRWINNLDRNGNKISIEGKGRAVDNIWIEHFWKIIKYNNIYLNPCDIGLELYDEVQKYIENYHNKKHQETDIKP
jgi:putative transposase